MKRTAADMALVESRLGFLFPESYVSAMGTCGAFSVRAALLDIIVDRNLDLREISEFIDPMEIGETMRGWQEAGMPEGLVPIAKDCMGNLFCFDLDDGQEIRRLDGPVYFWDHDFNEVQHEAASFETWIGKYNSLGAKF